MTPTAGRATRSDAQRNREQILEVARRELTASPGASLTSIAKRAGVGIGTLYRHFPTREALIFALYQETLAELIGRVPGLLAEHPPMTALRLWFDEVARYGRLKFGVSEVVHAATAGGDANYGPFVSALGSLLAAGAADGSVKAGLDPEDVLLQLSVLWRIDPTPVGVARAERILQLIIDGLRPR